MSTYTATRITARLYEYVTFDADGNAVPSDCEEDFNDMPFYHFTESDSLTFDSVAELVAAVRQDYVRFDATGADWATDPDGSRIINYETSEREAVSWHFDSIPDAILSRVIVPAVDAR